MTVQTDVVQLPNFPGYTALLGWYQYTEEYNGTYRAPVEIPLYLKEYAQPIRKPRITEVNHVSTEEHRSKWDMTFQGMFYSSPDALSCQLAGFILTPFKNKRWTLNDKNGNVLSLGNINYVDLITMYVEGSLNKSSGGTWHRKDPDYFITPFGQMYSGVVVANWQPTMTVNPSKQQFSMTLTLEI